jgi:diguanylate cyclase (GGDEF)-like protein
MDNAKYKQSIRWKLAAAFMVVAGLVAVFVGGAIAIHFETVERAARLEAEHVAELIAHAVVENNSEGARLQEYVSRLYSMRKRDVTILDAYKKGIADANADEIGKTYVDDPGNEVGKTIQDGRTRTFIERNALRPYGTHQIVVPLRQSASDFGKAPVGAVLLEYTSIREELFAAERNVFYLITATGIVVVLLVTFFGLGIARRITQPLRNLKDSVERIAAEDYRARVDVTSHDEMGLLGSAFNKMAEDLSFSHAALQQEVHQHQLAAERAEYLAYYDSLTSLPNRSMFSKLLNQAISLARRDRKQLAVLFVDLDRFKNINDTLGHDAGDLLLQEVGKRLQGCLRDSDTVARLGGDEFVILLPTMVDAADAGAVAHKVLSVTGKPFVALGQEFRVTASVGISTYPGDGEDEQSLMKNADIAMYQAKEDGKNHFQFYSVQMNRNSFERLALESSLRRALDHGEFQLQYQPKIDARSGAIVGIEALLRWQHPELGMVAPAKFIPIAEETGLLVSIGKWVLMTACAQNVAWQQSGLPRLHMAVNLSRRQFADEGLLRDITSILEETGMSPALLELEIAESTLMHDVDKALGTLKAFKDLGVRLAIDNFGTGYSSLSNLRRFPIDTIKIDGSLIHDLSNQAENSLAEATIAMGRNLSLTVLAECVETKAQADFLRDHACDEFQGFYFSKPVTADKFAELLEAQSVMAAEET